MGFWKNVGKFFGIGLSDDEKFERWKKNYGIHDDEFGKGAGWKGSAGAFIDTLTGKTEKDHLERADALAEAEFEFQKSSHAEELEWQKEQFAKSQEMAQKNLDFQTDVAEKNFGLAQDTFAAQQRENEIARQREDTAYQRQVADLKAAGLSPLAVSGGAAASNMQVGTAPQYDAQGVTAAQGSMIQLAQEYAQLRNMAQGQYLTRRQAAVNERIGAAMALSDLSRERRINFQNMAMSTANLSMQYNRLRKENAYTDELIKNAQDTRTWSNKYGWRNLNNFAVLGAALKDIAHEFGISTDNFATAIKQGLEKIGSGSINIVNKLTDNSDAINEFVASQPESVQKTLNKMPADLLEEFIFFASLNPNINRKESLKVAAQLIKYVPDGKHFDENELALYIQKHGLRETLRNIFGVVEN